MDQILALMACMMRMRAGHKQTMQWDHALFRSSQADLGAGQEREAVQTVGIQIPWISWQMPLGGSLCGLEDAASIY